MDAQQFREAAHAAIEHVISYFDNLSELPVTPKIQPGFLKPQLPAEAPQSPEPWKELLADVSNKIQPGLTHWQHPNFFAFFPANVTYPSILGEIYSAAYTAPAFNWLCSPVCTELETIVMDWLAKALALPNTFLSDSEGGGVIQGSASEACIVAMVAARERFVRNALRKNQLLDETEGEDDEKTLRRENRVAQIQGQLVALGSEQAHSLAQKAANVLGLRYRSIPAGLETGCRVTGANLRQRLTKLVQQGLQPFFVLVTLGTTGTCAFDDLAEIAAVKRDYPEIWIHIDAAWAGPALICPEFREMCHADSLIEVDSLDLNLHKWMLTNFDASCMFVRNRADLINAMAITRSYLSNPDSLAGQRITDYRDWQLPLGRRFRALKIWFVLRTYGISGIQAVIRRHVAQGETFSALCRSDRGRAGGIVVVTGSVLCLTVIRCVAPTTADSTATKNGHVNGDSVQPPLSNQTTKRVTEIINEAGEFFITPAVVDGIQCIRVVGANTNTSDESYGKLFERLLETNKAVHQGA